MQIFVLFYLRSVCFFSSEFAHQAHHLYKTNMCSLYGMNVFCLYMTFGNNKQLNNSHSWVQTQFIKILPAYWTFVVHSSAYALTEPHTMLLLLVRTQLVATVVALLLELLWMKTENETERRSAQLRLSWSVCVCVCLCCGFANHC